MPKTDEEMRKTGYWRIFLGFPIVFSVMGLILIALFMRNETPKLYIIQGKPIEALRSIKKIYHESEDHQEILEYL